jgi:hypothetical protein
MIEVRGADLGRGNRGAAPDSGKVRAAAPVSHEIRSANLVKVNLGCAEVDS